ncbi:MULTISPECIES: RsmB/NOP family class I SAM-dependent RNA methyltransferase [Thermodesulfovibrio]|jgi:16S rRNA (cytosine967-C5)-methyltransferase|uniref:RsmB/NOP family class I SAM-dependent RNA methyltransferase n=1 Tax=Thermodesulfovibrio TaxID=28261 RepID=UPI0026360439|nr:transcription antitermination factor NusB [Thermodesulfovibrio sp.]
MFIKKQNPRQVAVKVLTEVLENKKALKFALTEETLSQFDKVNRAFLLEIIYGVLRNLFAIDWVLEEFYKNKESLSSNTINNLRCSFYQLMFMNIPAYAVTNEAVNTEKAFLGKPAVVNAIIRAFLRKYETEDLPSFFHNSKVFSDYELRAKKIPPNLSIAFSHPEWLIKRWSNRFSQEELVELLKANNEKAPISIAVKPEEREEIAEYFQKKGFKSRPTKHSPAGLIIEGQGYDIRKTLTEAPFFWVVQDEASQLVCFYLEPFEGATVLDTCSSPGGKTILTAALMKKGKILCLENSRIRMKLLHNNLKRIKRFIPNVEIQTKLVDVLEFQTKATFDRVLLDAPCSSLGVIRRNPDVRYRLEESEIKRLAETQKLMIEKVSSFVSPQGILIYSVCSTEKEEGEEVVDSFLQKRPEFSSIKILRTFPHLDGMDGFFIAKLLRRE